jgi:hypothetical protein
MKSLAFFLSPAMALLCSEGAIHLQGAVSLLDGKKNVEADDRQDDGEMRLEG